ncbi:hypothetical protein sos41_17570 [Alphaproteobacteria bacterium SO-S41]|nr:hypothetical protein sos41_17570 [Alphaproteobacteria bacterium SO-S41]
MTTAWRLVLLLALLAMIGPALAAILIVAFGRAQGCLPEAAACGTLDLGGWLAFTLDWSWHRILGVWVLASFSVLAAAGAAYGFESRARAVMWGFMGACWGCIAALILPYAAIVWSAPPGCHITETGIAGCIVWGHPMGDAFALAAPAFWRATIIIPISLGGVVLTFVLATLRRPVPGGTG